MFGAALAPPPCVPVRLGPHPPVPRHPGVGHGRRGRAGPVRADRHERPRDLAANWTSAIGVGNVTSVTLNISKDNVQFGLRAIDKAGHRSPAAFPQVVS
jgi:hypothetical protein